MMIETIHFSNDSNNTNMHGLEEGHYLYANKTNRSCAVFAHLHRNGPDTNALRPLGAP